MAIQTRIINNSFTEIYVGGGKRHHGGYADKFS